MDNSLSLEIQKRFKKQNIKWALGGSGLMFHLGLTKEFGDWDMTTDVPQTAVKEALKDLPVKPMRKTKIFQSSYCYRIAEKPQRVDVIGGFTVAFQGVKYPIPTRVLSVNGDIPLASPEWWSCAYWLMGELAKSESLFSYVKRNGADMRVLSEIIAMDWPPPLNEKVRTLI